MQVKLLDVFPKEECGGSVVESLTRGQGMKVQASPEALCCCISFLINIYELTMPCCILLFPHPCDVSLSKTLYPLLSTGSTQEDPSQHD